MISNKNKKKYSRGEIAKIILRSLLVAGAVVLVLSSPHASQIITNYFKGDRRKFIRSVGNLKKSKYVSSYSKDGKEMVEITEKGKRRLLHYDFEDMKIKMPKHWDGIWRVVIYDINEQRKKSRERFVIKLKEFGFLPYQKSIFVFPFKCKEEIDFMKEHLFLGDSIHYIEASYIDDEDLWKKKFSLQ